MMYFLQQLNTAFTVRMAVKRSYEEAIQTLNRLQSNDKKPERIMQPEEEKRQNVPRMISFLNRAGMNLDDVDKLSIIHVSGTKGKGSTCAYCESILRTQGYKTGFLSSPHLLEERERVRIDGKPVSRDLFTRYFWDCFHRFDQTKANYEDSMPRYASFLTLMAMHVFIQEKVDAAIIEVGCGGVYDYTNFIRSPVVCGITSLGLEHTHLLGDTLEEIAWNKAGIIKPGVPVVTLPQPKNALQVITEQAQRNKSQLFIAPALKDNVWQGRQMELGISGEVQAWNASLAIQLCDIWTRSREKVKKTNRRSTEAEENNSIGPQKGAPVVLTSAMTEGLKNCRWPGRCQILDRESVKYFIDGAHTPESIQMCVNWYSAESENVTSSQRTKPIQVLLFNLKETKDPIPILSCIKSLRFDLAVFCPNIVSSDSCADFAHDAYSRETQLARCAEIRKIWLELKEPNLENKLEKSEDSPITASIIKNMQNLPLLVSKDLSQSMSTRSPTVVFATIQEALDWISGLAVSQRRADTTAGDTGAAPDNDDTSFDDAEIRKDVHVLCTGSLYLVGGVLKVLDPDICDR